MSFKKSELPTFAIYKSNCHSSLDSWLVYQSGMGEIRLINFNKDACINQIFILDVSSEPIQSIRLAYDSQENEIYVAIAYHSKFIILKKNYVIAQFSLTLNCNIVDFENGFVGVQGVSDGRQVYFVFVTALGKIVTQPVSNIENRSIFDLNIDKKRVSSIAASEGWAYIGSQTGQIYKFDLNSRKSQGKYSTKSELPIINLRLNKNTLIAGTCEGQIHILNTSLQHLSVVTAHSGMITLLHFDQGRIYSVGDDSVLRIWNYDNKLLYERGYREYNQRPNLLFTVQGQTYINFYQSMKYEPI